MIRFYLFHFQDIHNDFSVHFDIFRHKNSTSGQICAFLFFKHIHMISINSIFKFRKYIRSNKRLGDESIYSGFECLIHNFIPVISSKNNYGSLIIVILSDFLCCFNSVLIRHLPIQQHKIIRLLLHILKFHHSEGLFCTHTYIRPDAGFIKHHSCMFSRNFLIIYD